MEDSTEMKITGPASKPVGSLTRRTEAALADPKILDEALEFIANGGTLIGFARTRDIKHGKLHNFMCRTPEDRKRLMAAMNQRAEFDREFVMGKLRGMLQTDVRELFTADGAVKPVDEWPDGVAAMVSGLEVQEDYEDGKDGEPRENTGRTSKVKLVDPLAIIKLMGQELGLFTQKIDVSHKVTLGDLVVESLIEEAAPAVIEEAVVVADAVVPVAPVPRETGDL